MKSIFAKKYNGSETYIYKIETYNNSCQRVIKMPVSIFGKTGRKGAIKRDKDDRIEVEKLKSSVSRSKRNIRRICLSNDFEYFATWTINSEYCDRFTITSVQQKMRELLKSYQRKFPDFKYIYVFEKHQDGAIHMHGMVKGMRDLKRYFKNDFDKLPYYIIDTIEKGRKIYFSEFFNNKLGYNTFTKIENYNACCNYIIKYITKDPIRNENDQVYFCSKGLSKCITEEFLTTFNEKFLDGAYETYIDYFNLETNKFEKKLLCSVKDIYIDAFNKSSKIDYLVESVFNDNFI